MQLIDQYRPKTLDEIIGNEKPVTLLRHFLANPFSSSWLFEGPSGIGKTSAAQIIAKTLATNVMDFQTYNGRDVDQRLAEQIRDVAQMLPFNGGWRVIIIDEADQMTEGAQVQLLSVLENLGSKTIVIMTSNEKEDFEPRFLSRLKVLKFSTYGLSARGIEFLQSIAKENGMELDKARAKKIMEDSKNNIRAAIQALEMDLLFSKSFGG